MHTHRQTSGCGDNSMRHKSLNVEWAGGRQPSQTCHSASLCLECSLEGKQGFKASKAHLNLWELKPSWLVTLSAYPRHSTLHLRDIDFGHFWWKNKRKYEQRISSLCCLVKKRKTMQSPKACLRLAKSCNRIVTLQQTHLAGLFAWGGSDAHFSFLV